MSKTYYIIILVTALLGNFFFAFKCKEQTGLNEEMLSFTREVQEKSVTRLKKTLKNICEENNNEFAMEDSLNNKILIRIPEKACAPCLSEFWITINNLYDSIPHKEDVRILISLPTDRRVKEFQTLVKFRVVNFPDLHLAFGCEHENYPYLVFYSNNKLKFPLSGHNSEETMGYYMKTLLSKVHDKPLSFEFH